MLCSDLESMADPDKVRRRDKGHLENDPVRKLHRTGWDRTRLEMEISGSADSYLSWTTTLIFGSPFPSYVGSDYSLILVRIQKSPGPLSQLSLVFRAAVPINHGIQLCLTGSYTENIYQALMKSAAPD